MASLTKTGGHSRLYRKPITYIMTKNTPAQVLYYKAANRQLTAYETAIIQTINKTTPIEVVATQEHITTDNKLRILPISKMTYIPQLILMDTSTYPEWTNHLNRNPHHQHINIAGIHTNPDRYNTSMLNTPDWAFIITPHHNKTTHEQYHLPYKPATVTRLPKERNHILITGTTPNRGSLLSHDIIKHMPEHKFIFLLSGTIGEDYTLTRHANVTTMPSRDFKKALSISKVRLIPYPDALYTQTLEDTHAYTVATVSTVNNPTLKGTMKSLNREVANPLSTQAWVTTIGQVMAEEQEEWKKEVKEENRGEKWKEKVSEIVQKVEKSVQKQA